MELTFSMQKYLITIFLLSLHSLEVRQIDIAVALGYSKASVSRAIHLLKQSHYISINNHNIDLTPFGQKTINTFIDKYLFFYQLLILHEFSHFDAQNYALKLMNDIDEVFIQKNHQYHKKIGVHIISS